MLTLSEKIILQLESLSGFISLDQLSKVVSALQNRHTFRQLREDVADLLETEKEKVAWQAHAAGVVNEMVNKIHEMKNKNNAELQCLDAELKLLTNRIDKCEKLGLCGASPVLERNISYSTEWQRFMEDNLITNNAICNRLNKIDIYRLDQINNNRSTMNFYFNVYFDNACFTDGHRRCFDAKYPGDARWLKFSKTVLKPTQYADIESYMYFAEFTVESFVGTFRKIYNILDENQRREFAKDCWYADYHRWCSYEAKAKLSLIQQVELESIFSKVDSGEVSLEVAINNIYHSEQVNLSVEQKRHLQAAYPKCILASSVPQVAKAKAAPFNVEKLTQLSPADEAIHQRILNAVKMIPWNAGPTYSEFFKRTDNNGFLVNLIMIKPSNEAKTDQERYQDGKSICDFIAKNYLTGPVRSNNVIVKPENSANNKGWMSLNNFYDQQDAVIGCTLSPEALAGTVAIRGSTAGLLVSRVRMVLAKLAPSSNQVDANGPITSTASILSGLPRITTPIMQAVTSSTSMTTAMMDASHSSLVSNTLKIPSSIEDLLAAANFVEKQDSENDSASRVATPTTAIASSSLPVEPVKDKINQLKTTLSKEQDVIAEIARQNAELEKQIEEKAKRKEEKRRQELHGLESECEKLKRRRVEEEEKKARLLKMLEDDSDVDEITNKFTLY